MSSSVVVGQPSSEVAMECAAMPPPTMDCGPEQCYSYQPDLTMESVFQLSFQQCYTSSYPCPSASYYPSYPSYPSYPYPDTAPLLSPTFSDDSGLGVTEQEQEQQQKPLSKWKAKQLKLSPAGVTKRRTAANKRERKRMTGLNSAWERLRDRVPGLGTGLDKKMSKMDTLQMANIYIRHLVGLLQEGQ